MAGWEDDALKAGLGLAGGVFGWMTDRERLQTQERVAEIQAGASIEAAQARAAVGIAQAAVQPATATIYTANTRMIVLVGMMLFFGSLLFRSQGRNYGP